MVRSQRVTISARRMDCTRARLAQNIAAEKPRAAACATTLGDVIVPVLRCYGVGVAVLVGVRETSMPSVCEPSTTIRPLRKPRMVLAYPAKAL